MQDQNKKIDDMLSNISGEHIPYLAKGTVAPYSIRYMNMLEAKKKAEAKKARRHDYAVALFSAIIGAFFGAIGGIASSLIFWLYTKP